MKTTTLFVFLGRETHTTRGGFGSRRENCLRSGKRHETLVQGRSSGPDIFHSIRRERSTVEHPVKLSQRNFTNVA